MNAHTLNLTGNDLSFLDFYLSYIVHKLNLVPRSVTLTFTDPWERYKGSDLLQ